MEARTRLWIATLAILAACIVLVLWLPLLRVGSLPSINYNEGWNVYRQSMTVEGRPLYAGPPTFWITNYPPLSFHLVGMLGAAIGNMVLAGRITSFVALIALAALTGGIVRTVSGSARAGLHAGLCLLLWIATFTPERRAMNDPGLLGAAVAALGLWAYIQSSAGKPWLGLSALAFALAMFVKQDLLALPLGVAANLVATRHWKALAVWAGAGGLAACLLLAVTIHLDGPYLIADLLRPRAYLPGNLVENVFQYMLHFAAPLVVCTTVLIRNRPRQRDCLLILLLVTHLTSIVLSGGDGVASNIFYPSLIALAVSSGVALGSMQRSAQPNRLRPAFVAALIVPVLAGGVFVPFQFDKDLATFRDLPIVTKAARQTITLLKATDGPAMCEDILLCYQAGKPIDDDPFFVKDQLSIGRLSQSDMLALLVSHHYAAIEVDGPVHPTLPMARRRFSKAFMQTLASQYRLVSADQYYALFEPRDPPGQGPLPLNPTKG